MTHICPIQHQCTQYDSGDNKPNNHDVRVHFLCAKYEDCEAYLWNMNWLREKPACNLKKVREMKRKMAEGYKEMAEEHKKFAEEVWRLNVR